MSDIIEHATCDVDHADTGNRELVTVVGFENVGMMRSTRLPSGATGLLRCSIGERASAGRWFELDSNSLGQLGERGGESATDGFIGGDESVGRRLAVAFADLARAI